MVENTNTPSPAMTAAEEVAVVMVPLPAQGHLNQLLHLSILLSSTYGVAVHYAAAAPHNRQAKLRLLSSSAAAPPPSLLRFHDLDVPPFPSPPPDPSAFFPTHLLPTITAAPSLLRRPLSALLRRLAATHRRLAVVHDSLMGGAVQDAIVLHNVDLYAFHSTSAFNTIALRWHLYGKPSSLTADLLRPPLNLTEEDLECLPTLEEFWPKEMTELLFSQYKFLPRAKGRIFNTCRALEGEFIDMICRNDTNETRYWAIGPFLCGGGVLPSVEGGCVCMEWLAQQPEKSVLYVSFGTTTTMCLDQIKELALGLENSGQRFLWVLREADMGDIFSGEKGEGQQKLPEGYEGRVKGRGLVVTDWVPQTDILRHSSVGGFMSHCGWNSCIEALTTGVPLAAWPMHSDQTNNAILLTKVLRVGVAVIQLELRKGAPVVSGAAVETAVRRLMATTEGGEWRQKAEEVKSLVLESVMEGGGARKEMDSFFDYITRR